MTPHSLSRSSETCPWCKSDDNTVADSRPSTLGRRRRRRCNKCRTCWTTVEVSNDLVRNLIRAMKGISPLLFKTEQQITEMRTIVLESIADIDKEGQDNG